MAKALSNLILEYFTTVRTISIDSSPAASAPNKNKDRSFVPSKRKARQIPGKAAWEMASPTSDSFFRTIKQPKTPAETPSKVAPAETICVV